jgi:NADH:ubiquinone oxidoreductase subunit E
VQAPTALEVLKEAMDARGEIADEDRRRASELSGLPEAAVYGVSTFYDDLLQPRGARHVLVCSGTACFAACADAQIDELRSGLGLELGERTEDRSLSLGETVCLGFCHSSPAVRVGGLVDAGRDVIARVLAGEEREAPEPDWRTTLERPVLTREGDWSGLAHAVRELTPEQLLAEVKDANVRGRGGAGFPAGSKWQFTRDAPGEEKFIVANGDEGDPGSYIDKYLMERAPGLVLEGIALAGYAVGASHGFILCRSEYPRSKPALEAAAQAARGAGMLGADIGGSGFDFDITVIEGAGSYVVGEETALLACVEGRRGVAVPRGARTVRAPDGRQQRRDPVEHAVHRVPRRCGIPRAQPGCDRRLEARLLQRALRPPGRVRGAVRDLDPLAL